MNRFPILALSACLLLAPPALAQRPEGGPEWRGRTYEAGLDQLRDALLAAWEKAGLALDGEAERETEGELVTGYVEFTRRDFGPDVATAPPPLSRAFPFLLKQNIGEGKYRVRARLDAREEGARAELLVEIVSPAFNRITYEHTEVDRESNGVIEAYFLDRVEIGLHRPAPSGDGGTP